MSLPLTQERLRAVYASLQQFPPFTRMRLPAAGKVKFRVRRTKALDGEYARYCGTDEHFIEVSELRNGHWNTVGQTMAHEMIHLHQARAKTETRGQHNADFQRLAKIICRRFGWDFKQFI